ncbi:MAG: DUF4011 domain-containing protein, partial [Planctomycetota bacterium]
MQADEGFAFAIDVARARSHGIRPLPARRQDGILMETDDQAAAACTQPVDGMAATSAPSFRTLSEVQTDAAPADRVEHWKRRLLDLSLRNRLLNFRESKKTIPLLCPDPGHLEDALSQNRSFKLHPLPPEWSAEDPRRPSQAEADDPLARFLDEELEAKRLRAAIGETELERRLIECYRQARSDQEEGGANTLFLGLGMLHWKEATSSDRVHQAPLILLPVSLERPSVQQGVRLRRHDDEARVNVTLLELLRQDYRIEVPGVDPLPEDEHGVDVEQVLLRFQQAVKDQPGWEVSRETWLALFSFAKYLIWKDLQDRSNELKANDVVRHLIDSPREGFDDGIAYPEPRQLDDRYPPARTFCPLSADSSQMAAVFAAAEGANFVLEGPPGTGKSQTITNMIAQCLGQGKTVLFVSEKMAALDVVQRRLSDIGLGPFCLELHSAKASKRAVLDHLKALLELGREAEPRAWQRLTADLERQRNELNDYVRCLHQAQDADEISAYQCLAWLVAHDDLLQLSLPFDTARLPAQGRIPALRQACEQLAVLGNGLQPIRSHALHGMRARHWHGGWESAGLRACERARAEADVLRQATEAMLAALDCTGLPVDRSHVDALGRIAEVLPQRPKHLPEALWHARHRQTVWEWIDHGRAWKASSELVAVTYEHSLLEEDLRDLRQRWREARSSLWPWSWWRARRVRRELARHALDGAKPEVARVAKHIDQALQAQLERAWLREQAAPQAAQLLAESWRSEASDWEQIASLCTWIEDMQQALGVLLSKSQQHASVIRALSRLPVSEACQLCQRLRSAIDAFRDAYQAWLTALDMDPDLLWSPEDAEPDLRQIGERIQAICNSHKLWRPWTAYQEQRARAAELPLLPLIDAYECGQAAPQRLADMAEGSFRSWLLDGMFQGEPRLSRFSSQGHQALIERFQQADQQCADLARQHLRASLSARVPDISDAKRQSGLGVLRHELGKKMRHIPIRKLLAALRDDLADLAPCLLMSPLSVAQYLDARQPPFDLVIFDEASQIPTWDAIGAVARGRQLVVVGDPKQLPPTAFFGRSDGADDDEAVEDLESILDQCIASGVRTRHLSWHYRSRSEQLIAFSNQRYYDGKLYTFPNA